MAGSNLPPGRILHWLIALAVLAALASGYALTRPGTYSVALLQVHIALGASAGLLSLGRVLVWLTIGAPPPVFADVSPMQSRLARPVHALLRLIPLLLLVSGTGMLALSGAAETILNSTLADLTPFQDLPPRNLHHGAALLLAGLIGLHSLAALWHRLRQPAFLAG